MPQMKPMNWLFIFLMIIFSLMSLVSFMYFFSPSSLLLSQNTTKMNKLFWTWKW